jgi:hypothetical protein
MFCCKDINLLILGQLKKNAFLHRIYTSGPTADDIQDDAIVPAAAVINVTLW